MRQLEARLGGPVSLTDVMQGTEDGKPLLCGTAATAGGEPRPFVLRNGFLIMPEEAGPEAFAALTARCTEPAA